jgi:hypothetical protein
MPELPSECLNYTAIPPPTHCATSRGGKKSRARSARISSCHPFAAISFRYTQARLYTLQPKFLRDSRGPSGSEQPSGIIIDALAGRCGRAADEQRSLQHVRLQFAQREVAISQGWRQTDNRNFDDPDL